MTCPRCGREIPFVRSELRLRCPDPLCGHLVTDAEEAAWRASVPDEAKRKDEGAKLWEDKR